MESATSPLRDGQLGPLDDIMPPLVAGLILCFPCEAENTTQILNVVNRAVENLIHESPSLAGQVTRNESESPSAHGLRPGQLLLEHPKSLHGPKVMVNDLTELDEYIYKELLDAGMPMSKLDSKIFAPPVGVATTSNVMDVIVNFIKGGCLLTVCVPHSFADAYGFYLIVAALARHCREVQATGAPSPPLPPPPKDRKMASEHLPSRISARIPASICPSVPASDYSQRKLRPELWRLLGLDWRPKEEAPAEPPFILASATSTKMFNLSAPALASVKRLCMPPAAEDGAAAGWVSTNDALVAFLWTAVMRARFPSSSSSSSSSSRSADPAAPLPPPRPASSQVSVAINGRRGLGVPADWPGNVVFCCVTELPLDDVAAAAEPADDDDEATVGGGLAHVAQSIRRRVAEDKQPHLLRDAVALAACIPDVRRLGNAFRSWLDANLVTTSLVDLPFYELDFGPAFSGGGAAGRPEAFRMPAGHFAGICCIQPRRLDGSVDFVVSMTPGDMGRLESDRLFQRHCTFVSE